MKLTLLIFSFLFCTLMNCCLASDSAKTPMQKDWPFDGMLGKFDKQSIQRGFQVYKEVCASCHSLKMISFRNFTEIGYSEAQVKALAAEYQVQDGPNDEGEFFERAARPSDRFPSPYPNEQAAKAANNGAYPPDLSLIIKARADGANYVYSLLTGYQEPPKGVAIGEGMNYNPYFSGQQIAMPAPLSNGAVEYTDNTQATVEQMTYDVVNFLQWAAEPEMQKAKALGMKVMLFLFISAVMFYIAMRRIWTRIKK
jgi:ubiquinol-cytochrome c reductase cytochrome c1 subunit